MCDISPNRDWIIHTSNDDRADAPRPGGRQLEAEPWISINSDDLSEPFTATWFQRPSLRGVLLPVNSRDFQDDEPARFSGLGPVAVATTLVMSAEALEAHPLREVREFGGRLRQYLEGEHYKHSTLDAFIGFRVSGTRSFDYRKREAERDILLLKVARLEPYADMGHWAAAKEIREGFDTYRDRTWSRLKEDTPPPATEPRLTWWRILQLGLGDQSMPSPQSIAGMIRDTRDK